MLELRLATVAAVLGLAVSASAQTVQKRIDIVTMNDTPQLLEVEKGVVEGLGDGFKVDFKSAQGNFATAQQIIRQFVGDQPDVIVAITTAPAQAAAAATKDVPVVFSAVTDPLRAKVVSNVEHPGGNVTGVCDEVPYERQMQLIREILPNMKRLGIVFDPGMDNSLSSIDEVKKLGEKMGFSVVLSPAVGGNAVAAAGQNLVGKADAIYVPNDTTVLAALESLVKVAQDAQLPLFTGERRSVQRGAAATIGYDFGEMGKVTARLVKQVLDGTKPGAIPVVFMRNEEKSLSLFVNKTSAAKMGLTIPPSVLARAKPGFLGVNLYALVGAGETGLAFALVAFGAYLTFRVLDFPDLTVEGSFPFGAAVVAALMTRRRGLLGGDGARGGSRRSGWAGDGVAQPRLRILHILAGILTSIALYSVSLRVMGRPNIAAAGHGYGLSRRSNISACGRCIAPLILLALLVSSCTVLLDLFLATATGLRCGRRARMRGWRGPTACAATGWSMLGLAIGQWVDGLSGALFAQMLGAADVSMGIGVIVVALAAVIGGTALMPSRIIAVATLACVLGSVLYRLGDRGLR